jgi:hypothetical protein
MDKSKFNDKKEWRKFGISVGVIFLVIATIQLILGKDLFPYFYGTAALFFIFALALPLILKPVFILFSYLGMVMGWFMTRIILTVLFYLVITPIGLFSKLMRKRFLALRQMPTAESYWIDRIEKTDNKQSYENQY